MPVICRDNFHVTKPTDRSDAVFAADRFLVAKFLRPRRWDLTVFRFPENPEQTYVMRLVGLPGETITIKDGQISANGKLLTLPDSLRGIEYQAEMTHWYGPVWGSEASPAQLGADEYFVLGDFSVQSRDSRFWEMGAPGHSPFAVPDSHLRGVVTHTYWPLSRWRAFR